MTKVYHIHSMFATEQLILDKNHFVNWFPSRCNSGFEHNIGIVISDVAEN